MCSILGIFDSNEISEDTINIADLILKKMKNRGPDSTDKIIINKTSLLGSTRLSIVDMSNAGKMPLSDKSGMIPQYIEDQRNVEKRRKEVGLGSMKDELKVINDRFNRSKK